MIRTRVMSHTKYLKRFAGRPVSDLKNEYEACVRKADDIRAQLAMRRTEGDGLWRTGAIITLNHTVAKQRALKMAMAESNRRFNLDAPLHLDSVEGLIHAALVLLHRLASEGVDLDPEEQAIKDALDSWLRTNGRVAP